MATTPRRSTNSAIVQRKQGKFGEASDAYTRAVQIDPNYALAWLNLGVLCDLYLQEPQRALEAYERYLATASSPRREGQWLGDRIIQETDRRRAAKCPNCRMSTPMSTMRFTLPSLLMFAFSWPWTRAEPQGTLSREATAAGPAVDTSATTNVSQPSAAVEAAAAPATPCQRVGRAGRSASNRA